MKSKTLILIVLAILIIPVATFALLKNLPIELGCDELKDEIATMIADANSCQNDSDCLHEARYSCPFGCDQLFNKNADLAPIDQKVALYNGKRCQKCVYGCVAPPKPEDIKCISNKCVDKNLLR